MEAVYTHPDFEENNGQFTSDIGLVFTSEDFVLHWHVDTACLPTDDSDLDLGNCFVAGFGKNQSGAHGSYQHIIQGLHSPW